MLPGTSVKAAHPNCSGKNSAKKYPVIISAPAKMTAIMSHLMLFLFEIKPARAPSTPFITKVKGAKYAKPEATSAMDDPIDPAKPPTTGPKVNALTKIIMSPKFMYPLVGGLGICTKTVATATSAANTPEKTA